MDGSIKWKGIWVTYFMWVLFNNNFLLSKFRRSLNYNKNFLHYKFYSLDTIGSFVESTGVMKTDGIFQIITTALAYYSAFGMTINERYKKVWIPVLDGK